MLKWLPYSACVRVTARLSGAIISPRTFDSSILAYGRVHLPPEAMKSWAAALVLILTSLAFAGAGKIRGIVVDETGVPTKHITVEALPLDIAWNGVAPNAVTDEHGRFVISVSAQSHRLRWRVYPHQEDLYYPDLSERFYQTNESRGEVVQLDDNHLEANVQLRLGRKAGVLRVTVTNALTSVPLQSFYCELTRTEDINNWLHVGNQGGYLVLLLPSNTDITLTILSSGYKPWTYPGVINVGPGEEFPLDIQLQAGGLTILASSH
jgi:hypothetical protein